MTTVTITPPISRIPIGVFEDSQGRSIDVRQHPEFVRFFFDLFGRVGGTSAMDNTQLQTLILSLDDATARLDQAAAIAGQLRDAIASVQAGEMVFQQATADAPFSDVMQNASIDVLASEVTWHP